MKLCRSVALGLWLAVLATPAFAGELSVTIDGLRSARGSLLIGLYDSRQSFDRAIELSDKEGFLNDPERVAGLALRAHAGLKGGVTFQNLEPGRYALIIHHDEDGNGRLNKTFWGVPTEPYAFSNEAQPLLGPPTFREAAITLDGSDKSVRISLIYHGSGLASLLPSYRDEDANPKTVVGP